MSDVVSPYVLSLLRRVARAPAVLAVYTRTPVWTVSESDVSLVLVAEAALAADLPTWLADVGETALLDPCPDGCRVITTDGTVVDVALIIAPQALPPGELQGIYRRDGADVPAQATAAEVPPDLTAGVGRFWGHLYVAATALGRGWPFTAHGELELCRSEMVALYRAALAPGSTGSAWAGVEAFDRVGALSGMTPWLVAPLQTREQWRSAHQLAAAYESLMLPLLERLNLPYPWAIRNLAFARLDAVRPDGRRPTAPPSAAPDPEPPPQRAQLKVRIRHREPKE